MCVNVTCIQVLPAYCLCICVCECVPVCVYVCVSACARGLRGSIQLFRMIPHEGVPATQVIIITLPIYVTLKRNTMTSEDYNQSSTPRVALQMAVGEIKKL